MILYSKSIYVSSNCCHLIAALTLDEAQRKKVLFTSLQETKHAEIRYQFDDLDYDELPIEISVLLLVARRIVVHETHTQRILSEGLKEMRAGKISIGLRSLLHANGIRIEYVALSDLQFIIDTYLHHPFLPDMSSLAFLALTCNDRFMAEEISLKLKTTIDALPPISGMPMSRDDSYFSLINVSNSHPHSMNVYAKRIAKYLAKVVLVQHEEKICIAHYLNFDLSTLPAAIKPLNYFMREDSMDAVLRQPVANKELGPLFKNLKFHIDPHLHQKEKVMEDVHYDGLLAFYLSKPFGYGNMMPIITSKMYLQDCHVLGNRIILNLSSEKSEFEGVMYNNSTMYRKLFEQVGKRIQASYLLRMRRGKLLLMVNKIHV